MRRGKSRVHRQTGSNEDRHKRSKQQGLQSNVTYSCTTINGSDLGINIAIGVFPHCKQIGISFRKLYLFEVKFVCERDLNLIDECKQSRFLQMLQCHALSRGD